MPRKDTISGVMVMTDAEFWTMMAEKEGKGRTAGDLVSDHYQQLADEEIKEEQRLLSDKAYTLHLIQTQALQNMQYEHEDRTADPKWWTSQPSFLTLPFPVEILELSDAGVHWGRSSYEQFKFIAQCDDGVIRRGEYTHSHYSGSFYEPPDDETEVIWEMPSE